MKLFGKKSRQESDTVTVLEQGYVMRDNYWSTIGKLDDDVIAPIINPGLVGLPMWPNLRQSIRLIHLSDGKSLLTTDGLSDPFNEQHHYRSGKQGFELEFYIITDEKLTPETASRSWQMSILYQLGLQCAHAGNFREIIDKHKYVSIELFDTHVPDKYKTDEKAGIILGLESKIVKHSIDLPKGNVRLISAVLLTHEETLDCAKGEEYRTKVASRILSDRKEAISLLQ
jgi:hypothetical protein